MSDILEPPFLDFQGTLKKSFKWASAAGIITIFVTLFMPNYYKSETRLLPVDSKSSGGIGNLGSMAAALGVAIPGGESNDANFVDVLNSRWLREQLLQTEFQYHVRSWRFGAEHIEKATLYACLDERNMDRAIKELDHLITTSRDLKSKVISISAETRSPELSQLIVQRAGRLLEIFLQQKGRTRGGAKAAFAEARLTEARHEMDAAEEAFRHFLEGNRNFQTSSDPRVRLMGFRLETELRLRQQIVTTLAINREQSLLEEKNDIPILNVLDPPNLPLEKSKPTRSTLILGVFFLVMFGVFGWGSRRVLMFYLQAE